MNTFFFCSGIEVRFLKFEVTQTGGINGKIDTKFFCCSCPQSFDDIGEMGKHLKSTVISQEKLLEKEPEEVKEVIESVGDRVYQHFKNKTCNFIFSGILILVKT